MSEPGWAAESQRMVSEQLRQRGIKSEGVLKVMERLPRHLFVPHLRSRAYDDAALPIECGQTISQPWMVAAMTAALGLQGTERVLEIGTGSGYQCALLALLAAEVYSVERIPQLAEQARIRLARLGLGRVHLKTGDGSLGWPEAAPFDGILVTAGAPSIPPPLLEQLAVGGRLVIPVGEGEVETLVRVTRERTDLLHHESLVECRFVPLLGRYGFPEGGPSPREQ